ncbi:MAG: hypothetical protein DWQ19_10235 [Crenarchaeota archaeon]|nr:MAG: hypothetical protein DWQ19_10235 [Thermoproteota archaeon]
MDHFEYFRARYGLRPEDVNFFPYGSRVYGTASEQSDYDYIAIIPAERRSDTGTEFNWNNVNIHMFNQYDWQQQLNRHKIHTLEVYFLPDGCRKMFNFKLDRFILRNELMAKSRHSFIRAKKKIEVEKEFILGWKSLFHSLRILVFGTQLVKMGKIADYSAANHYWFDIRNSQITQWDLLKEKYEPEHKKLLKEFLRKD